MVQEATWLSPHAGKIQWANAELSGSDRACIYLYIVNIILEMVAINITNWDFYFA